jgi:hypothetical protein
LIAFAISPLTKESKMPVIQTELQHTRVTLAQAIALHKVYSRAPIYETPEHAAHGIVQPFEEWIMANVSGPFFNEGVVMVQWADMILGIEPDGYTHS